jgi:dUTP pyrophosphatase
MLENDASADIIQQKLLDAIDPTKDYTMDDFETEIQTMGNEAYNGHSEMFKFPIKFMNKSNNKDPEYATIGSAGFDFRANLDNSITLEPGKTIMVPTGLYFELPDNLELQVRPRSGLAAKYGITVLNSPGTVDSDYRGEVKVILINHGNESFVIENGERIAQGVIANVVGKMMINFDKSDSLNDSDRGEGGFGSTGVK